jgi:hypothetical protein
MGGSAIGTDQAVLTTTALVWAVPTGPGAARLVTSVSTGGTNPATVDTDPVRAVKTTTETSLMLRE